MHECAPLSGDASGGLAVITEDDDRIPLFNKSAACLQRASARHVTFLLPVVYSLGHFVL